MRALFDTIGRIAARQHGRISHSQLVAAGVDRNRIARWTADGRLRRVHREVYAVGHTAASLHADLMAAVLACGASAVVSHRSAAHALGIVARQPRLPEITVASTAGRLRPGIVVHRVRALPTADTTRLHGIAIATVPRVLLDLAPTTSPTELTRAGHEAWVRYRTAPAHVEACIARNPTKKGAAKLLRALGSDVTLSDLEDGFLALLHRHGLPRPRTNIDVAGDKVDCHWPQLGLTIELLGYRFHASRRAFEDDVARRRRSHHLAYTWGDVFERGDRTAAELTPLLALPHASSAHTPGRRAPAPGRSAAAGGTCRT
jgi:hypothetical protein